MKRTWHHPAEPKTGRRYWRSVAELEGRADFLNKAGIEFPNGDTLSEEEQENTRRSFLKIMGGSAGLMGLALTSCRRPLTNILPYTKHLEWIVPGKPLLYASAMARATGGVQPLVVTTHEGRPTHLAGNPLHPTAGSGVDTFSQASILDLYDPERSNAPARIGDKGRADWKKVNRWLHSFVEKAKEGAGKGVAILSGETSSPTVKRLQGEIAKAYPQVKFFTYEAISRDAQKAANAALFGAGVQSVVNLTKAVRIFSLDCDFLGLDPVGDSSTGEFMVNRDADKGAEGMNRLYILENRYTVTGGMADHRKPLAASLIPAAAAFLAGELGEGVGLALAANLPEDVKTWIKAAAEDLKAAKGKAVVLCGSRCGGEVHALVAAANEKLGAFGSVIELVKPDAAPESGGIADLVEALKSGAISTLVSLTKSDPLYDAPNAKALRDLLVEKKTILIHLGHLVNATGRRASLHIPAAHDLEAWGDVRSASGAYSITQPMIQPLYDGASEIDVLLALLGKKKLGPVEVPKADPAAPPAPPVDDAAYTAVRETFASVAGSPDEVKWNHTLRDGFLKGSSYAKGGAFNAGAVAGIVGHAQAASAPTKDALEVVLVPDSSVWDGRFAGNAWLQEAPDPITKLTWDNAAWIGSKTFRELGLKEGQKVKITVNGVELPEIAAIEAPGHVSNSITIPLGYGQDKIGTVGTRRGFNAYPLRQDASQFVLTGAKIEALDDFYELALTQEQNTMEGRALVREATVQEYKQKPDFAVKYGMDSHIPENISLYKGQIGRKSAENPEGFDYDVTHQWGMTIDLNKCLGCSACIIACQSENNIPVVGKDQVRRGRVMQWIRMDRYFATNEWGEQKAEADDVMIDPTAGQLENAEMVMQPVACQQCESAPCETVCPVNATVHTEEGLNAMAYNRCIGTRYCANNCPYTARRFNFFDYNKRNPLIKTKLNLGIAEIETKNLYAGPFGEKTPQESVSLQKNPNVTVRMRGVIEKCTYCVQRLEAAKINQKRLQRDSKNFRIPTDSVKVACQQACSAGAIEFGDIANEKSAVVKMKASPRNYELLKYIGTRPRTSYLARIRNVNPKMPGHEKIAAWSSKQF
jgi:molybdopterin-containing oxidoreductase family iron-sulfur binding subunit